MNLRFVEHILFLNFKFLLAQKVFQVCSLWLNSIFKLRKQIFIPGRWKAIMFLRILLIDWIVFILLFIHFIYWNIQRWFLQADRLVNHWYTLKQVLVQFISFFDFWILFQKRKRNFLFLRNCRLRLKKVKLLKFWILKNLFRISLNFLIIIVAYCLNATLKNRIIKNYLFL
jgi:hypothetical protein